MKPLLNTLYVTTDGAYLHRDGTTARVEVEGETRLRLPIHTLESIVAIGNVMVSPALMGLCAESNVKLSFLTMHGRFMARVQGPTHGNVLLRREQYRRADAEASSAVLASFFVIGKIANCRAVLRRAQRDRPDDNNNPALNQAEMHLGRLIQKLGMPLSLDVVRGHEGEAAKIYFGVFDHLITAADSCFRFEKRSRRPPLDPVNALLSFIYTLLVHDVEGALEAVGLDPAVGFLHRDRPGRPGLALDLIEELRPFLADRLVLSLINRGQVKASGFTRTESGAVVMDDATRKEVLLAWQKRKQEELTHPFLNEKIAIGLIPHIQAMLLARHLRGELAVYPPFSWK